MADAGVLHVVEGRDFVYLAIMNCALDRDFLQMYTIRQWQLPAYWDKSEALNFSWSVKASYNRMHNLKLNGIGETSFLYWKEAAFIVFLWNHKIHLMGKKLVNMYTREITAGTYCLLSFLWLVGPIQHCIIFKRRILAEVPAIILMKIARSGNWNLSWLVSVWEATRKLQISAQ